MPNHNLTTYNGLLNNAKEQLEIYCKGSGWSFFDPAYKLEVQEILKEVASHDNELAMLLQRIKALPKKDDALIAVIEAIELSLVITSKKDNTNVLMLQSQYGCDGIDLKHSFNVTYKPNDKKFKPFLAAIINLDLERKAKAFIDADKRGDNALMIATQMNTTAVRPLLSGISTLTPKQQAQVLMQVNAQGCNALMLALLFNPDAVEPILTVVNKLEKEDIAKVLIQCGERKSVIGRVDGFHKVYQYNALMIALQYCPKAVIPLLAAINTLEPESKAIIFINENSNYGYTPLSIALKHNPESVPLLLKEGAEYLSLMLTKFDPVIGYALNWALQMKSEAVEPLLVSADTLESEDKAKVLMQKDGLFQRNSLMLAVRRPHIAAVKSILAMINTLKSEVKVEVLMQTAKDGANVLEGALGCPEVLELLLAEISTLEIKEIISLLRNVDKSGCNVLMDAGPKGFEILLTFINTIEPSAPGLKADMLMQVDTKGANALMRAAKSQAKVVRPMLSAINGLEPQQKASVLTQVDNEGYNALMRVLRHQPQAIVPILSATKTLEKEEQVRVLTQRDLKGNSVLRLALQYYPAAVDILLSMINIFESNQKALALMPVDEKGDDILSYTKENYPEALEVLQAAVDSLAQEDRVPIKRSSDVKASEAVTDFFKTQDTKQEKKSAEDTLNSDEESASSSSPRALSIVYEDTAFSLPSTESTLRRRHGIKQ